MNRTSLAQNVLWILLLVQGMNAGAAAERTADRSKCVETGLLPAIVIEGRTEERFSLEERMHFYKTPGVSIAVINNGEIEWAHGYGSCEIGTTNLVTTDTVFQAASISKPVAAMVALRLVEEGKLDLDEDVNRKLVSWKLPENEFTKDKKVTLRLLLSHRGGLTDHAGFQHAVPSQPLPTLREILESGKWTPAPIRVGLEPGSRFQYSGGGFCLMEQLLEDVSGKPFPVLARELVLGPLHMTNSSFEQPLSAERAQSAASGHRTNGKRLPQNWNLYPATSAAGLWTTPTDLARFAIEIQKSRTGRSTKVLSQRMTAEILTPQGGQDDRDSKAIALMEGFSEKLALSRGLGVGLIGQPAIRFFHTGSNPGYQCELQAFMENGRGAVIMTSADQGWRLGREILWAIAKEYDWPGYDYEPDVKKVAPVTADELSRLVGQYRLAFAAPTKTVISVSRDGNQLFAQISDRPNKVKLYPESDSKFFAIEDAMSLTFVRDETGAISEIVSDQGWRAKRERIK
ncbi:MAG: serine hydrolase [Planctomycetota bacterium]